MKRAPAQPESAFTVLAPALLVKNRGAVARQRRAIGRTVKVFQELLDRFAPEQLEIIADQVHHVLAETSDEPSHAAFVRKFAEARDYPAEERAALRLETLLRSFRRRDELLRDSLTAAEVATILGTSRQTPHDRAASGGLLAALDRGVLRFPPWQFDPNGPDRVVAGLPDVIRALQPMSPIAKMNWFVHPNPYLDGRNPIDVLQRGDLQRVLDIAAGTGPK